MATTKRRKTSRKKQPLSPRRMWLLLVIALFAAIAVTYHYRTALTYYFSFRSNAAETDHLHDIRNFQVLSRHKGLSVGFDVSEYQGKINWYQTDSIEGTFPIDFVFIRATAGKDRPDHAFAENWEGARKVGLLRGAYHYYRPDENSIEQAELFIRTVRLQHGDLPPVLDIEKIPETQSIDSLKKGLRRWLRLVEKHYKVKPIIYSGEKYYEDFLHDEFGDEYVFWIANYNFFVEHIGNRKLWQFTEKGHVPGIIGPTDVNIFNGSLRELLQLTVRK